jgi:hypothetical protein
MSTARPRDRGGTHPGRSSCVWNVETPSRSRQRELPGRPTARRAEFLGGNRMTEKRSAPRGALSYPRFSREELEGGFLGPMAYPDPQGERDSSMPGRAMVSPGVRAEVSRDPRDMAKAGLPESQSPDDETRSPPERHLLPAPCSATTSFAGCRNLRGVERCPVRAVKEMSGAPKSRSDVRRRRTRDQPSGREPQGDGVPVVVVGATTHRGGRESRPQGEGAQATGHLGTGRYA